MSRLIYKALVFLSTFVTVFINISQFYGTWVLITSRTRGILYRLFAKRSCFPVP